MPDLWHAVTAGLRRRCRRLWRAARVTGYRRCDQRVKATTAQSSTLLVAVDEVR